MSRRELKADLSLDRVRGRSTVQRLILNSVHDLCVGVGIQLQLFCEIAPFIAFCSFWMLKIKYTVTTAATYAIPDQINTTPTEMSIL